MLRTAAGEVTRRLRGRRLPVRTQLIAIVAACLAPVALMLLLSAQEHRRLLIQQAGEQLAASARLHAAEQDHLVSKTLVLLSGLRQAEPVRAGDPEACRAALARVVADTGFLNGMGVSDARGDKFCHTNATSPVNLADRPFFGKAMRGAPAVGPMVVARTNGKAILPVAVPVLDDAGRAWRVLTTGVTMDAIASLVRAAALPEGGDLTIADARGAVLASTLPALTFGNRAPWAEVAGTGGTVAWGDQLLGVAAAHDGDLMVVASRPTAALLAASNRLFVREIAVIGVVMLAAALLAAAVAELVLARRLRTLVAVAGRLAGGDLSARANLPGGADEIGRLASAVDHMACSLETHVADLAAREASARHDAMHDPLTGLPNRSLLRERLAEVLLRCRRYGERAAVLCVDLDRFKEVNDTLGHGAGDRLLVACAARLGDCARETDTVARLGGDEFAVLQTDVGQTGDVQALCERLLQVLAEPFLLGEGHEAVVGASIGVALIPADGEDAARLLQHADIALYRAKADGRGRACFFEAGMDERLRRRKALEADLRAALGTDQLEVHYQPQLDARSGAVAACEALLRWRHPTHGMVPPAEFVPVAEETGLIGAIGEWVLRTACREAADWPGPKVSVNVSPVQFRQRDLAGLVARALADSGLPPERLEVEITEGVLMQGTSEALRTLRQLKALGVGLAMDDFGTGYSSLGYLQRFPFDKIKIDGSFVGGLGAAAGGAQDGAIVRAVVGLGRNLGMLTCAEGVETREQLERLREEGCDLVQGFLFGGPVPAPAIAALLRRPAHEPPAPAAAPPARAPLALTAAASP